MSAKEKLKDYHLAFGWEEIAKAPQPMLDKVKRAGKAGADISDVVYLAYQKKKRDLSFESRPDLMVIDGGKGQLSAAHSALRAKGLNIPVISLAKKLEEVYVPGESNPISLKSDSEGSYLLQRIRDEAHRFAIEGSRGSREKNMVKSVLDEIPGVGPKMKKKLLTRFGSVERIRQASQIELESLVGEDLAVKIKESL
ncbi:MAG: helix-hairpin-helix domain-containing protein [Candidatus Peregrinibacteria bacterium]